MPNRVAAPDVPIRAECFDQDGGRCEFSVYIAWDDYAHYYGITSSVNGSVDMTADLSGYDWHEGNISFFVTFSTGERSVIERHIYVEHSPILSRVARVDGEIIDVAPGRILYVRSSDTGRRFFIRSLEDGAIVELDAPVDMELFDDGYGWVTTRGALLVLREDDTDDAIVIDAREGEYQELARLADTHETVLAKGDYAIWRIGKELWRWTFSTGEALLIADNACPTSADLLEDGSVAYCGVSTEELLQSGSPGQDVYLFRAGAAQRITEDNARKEDIRSDGSHFVYKKITENFDWELGLPDVHLAVHDSLSERLLVTNQPDSVAMSYMMNEGWVAYAWSSESKPYAVSAPVWVTHVSGEPVQLGEMLLGLEFFESMGNDGSVVMSGPGVPISGFRLRSPALGEVALSLNTDNDDFTDQRMAGSARQLGAAWFFFLGDSLFEVRL